MFGLGGRLCRISGSVLDVVAQQQIDQSPLCCHVVSVLCFGRCPVGVVWSCVVVSFFTATPQGLAQTEFDEDI